MAYGGIDVLVKTEAGNTVIVGVEGLFGIFAENGAKGVDERFPYVGPVPARSSRDADGQADRSRSWHCVLGLQDLLTKGRFPFLAARSDTSGIGALKRSISWSVFGSWMGVDSGRVGYLLKDRVANVGEFTDAITTIAAGGTALDLEVVGGLLTRAVTPAPLAL